MKKLLTKIIPLIFCATFSVFGTQNIFAQNASSQPVAIMSIADQVADYLNKRVMANFYYNLLHAYSSSLYEFDAQIPALIDDTNNHNTVINNLNPALQKASENSIVDAFADINTKQQEATKRNEILGLDDVIGTNLIVGASGMINVFGGLSNIEQMPAIAAQNQQALQNQNMFNSESIFANNQYTDQNALTQATNYLGQIEALSPAPDVIRIGPQFKVPVQDPTGQGNNTLLIGEDTPLNANQITDLKNYLQTQEAYRDYRSSYRGVISARSLFINNLIRLVQERIPYVDQKGTIDYTKGKSLLQARDEQINRRLSPEYYQAISSASPASVQRETLFLLAQISQQLNTLQKQNEQLIAMQSYNGLMQIAGASSNLNQQAQNVGKLVYCHLPENKQSSICAGSTTAPSSASGDDTGQ